MVGVETPADPRRPDGTSATSIRRFLSDSAIYAGGLMVVRISGLLLIPLYASRLSRADFGLLGMYDTLVGVLALVATLGLAESVGYHVARKGHDFNEALGGALAATIVVALGLSGLVVLVRLPVAELLVGSANAYMLWFLAGSLIFNAVHNVGLAALRFAKRPWFYAGLLLAETVLKLSLNIVLVVFLNQGARGVLWSNLLTYGVLTLISLATFGWTALRRANWSLLRPMLSYGVTAMPGYLAARLEMSGNRLVLGPLAGLRDLGVYNLADKVAQLPQFINMPMSNAMRPHLYLVPSEDQATFQKLTGLMAAMVFMAVLPVSLLVPEIVHVLGAGRYPDAAPLVQWLLLGMMLRASSGILGFGAQYKGRPGVTSAVVLCAMLLNLLANLWLVPRHGVLGSAWAGAASTGLMVLGGALTSRRLMGFSLRFAEVATVIMASTLMAFAIFGVERLALGVRLLPLVVLLPLMVHMMRVVRRRRKPVAQRVDGAASA